MTRIVIKGAKELRAALENMSDEMAAEVGKAVNATGVEVRGDIVKRINRGPASGRTYQKYNPRRTHTASAPGQAPQTDTGRLAGSIVFKTEGPLTVSVASALAYASYLEFGTTKILPRPAWTPAAEAAGPKFRKRIDRALAGVIR